MSFCSPKSNSLLKKNNLNTCFSNKSLRKIANAWKWQNDAKESSSNWKFVENIFDRSKVFANESYYQECADNLIKGINPKIDRFYKYDPDSNKLKMSINKPDLSSCKYLQAIDNLHNEKQAEKDFLKNNEQYLNNDNVLRYNAISYYLKSHAPNSYYAFGNTKTDIAFGPTAVYLASCGSTSSGSREKLNVSSYLTTNQLKLSTVDFNKKSYLETSPLWSQLIIQPYDANREYVYYNDIVYLRLKANNWYMICEYNKENSCNGSYASVYFTNEPKSNSNEKYWKIVSTEKNKVGKVKLGDKIKLISFSGDTSYLGLCSKPSEDCGNGVLQTINTFKNEENAKKVNSSKPWKSTLIWSFEKNTD